MSGMIRSEEPMASKDRQCSALTEAAASEEIAPMRVCLEAFRASCSGLEGNLEDLDMTEKVPEVVC